MRSLVASILLFVPVVASATQWCLVRDGSERCAYATSELCYAAAGVLGGNCILNYRIAGNVGEAPWCLATSIGLRCTFLSKNLCNRQARRVNGGCVENQFAGRNKRLSDFECQPGDLSCELAEAGFEDQQLPGM